MNVTHKHLIAVIAMSVASSAAFSGNLATPTANLVQAGDSSYPVLPTFAPTKTRGEVKIELQQAREKGLIATTDSAYPISKRDVDRKSRSQVKAELEQSKNSGEKKRLDKEQYSG